MFIVGYVSVVKHTYTYSIMIRYKQGYKHIEIIGILKGNLLIFVLFMNPFCLKRIQNVFISVTIQKHKTVIINFVLIV